MLLKGISFSMDAVVSFYVCGRCRYRLETECSVGLVFRSNESTYTGPPYLVFNLLPGVTLEKQWVLTLSKSCSRLNTFEEIIVEERWWNVGTLGVVLDG